jgi:hypothetical protein
MLCHVRARSGCFALIALMSGIAGVGAASAGTNSPVCGPAGAHTLASNSLARVYLRNGNVYGCAATGPRSYRLGTSGHSFNEGRVGPIALAGVDAAYGLTTYGVDTVTAEVIVRHLTDGRVLRRHPAITGSVGAEFAEQVDDVVVKRDGSVAWIANVSSIASHGHATTEVDKSDRTSRTLLDRHASGIKLHSLRLAGSRLTWRYRTTTRSATLR